MRRAVRSWSSPHPYMVLTRAGAAGASTGTMTTRSILSLLVFTAWGGRGGTPVAPFPPTAAPPAADPRAELARLLERYDTLPAGADKAALAARIDGLAGQRYAAWSRLYWHRDLDAARAEAR